MKRLIWALLLGFTTLTFAKTEVLTLKTPDGFTLKGWLELPDKAKKPVPLALLVHEYASDHRMWDKTTAKLHTLGYATFAVDLRAHGASTEKKGKRVLITRKDFGHPKPEASLEKIPDDLNRWMELLQKRKDLTLESPLFFGSSLGGGALIPLMLDYEPRAVVTLSPAAARKTYAEDTADAVENSDVPWLIVSSQRDFAKKTALAYESKAMRPTLLILPGNGHGSQLLPAATPYIDLFLERILKKTKEKN